MNVYVYNKSKRTHLQLKLWSVKLQEVQKSKEIISIDICIQKNPAWLSLHSVQMSSNKS